MFTKELSIKILKIIDERNMTLESLSEATKLSRRFIGNVASGKQVPTLNSFEKICSALELEPNELLLNDKSKCKEKSIASRVNTTYFHLDGNIGTYIPVCPTCNALLKSDWQSYCDNCGQKLSWDKYLESKVILEKPEIKLV